MEASKKELKNDTTYQLKGLGELLVKAEVLHQLKIFREI